MTEFLDDQSNYAGTVAWILILTTFDMSFYLIRKLRVFGMNGIAVFGYADFGQRAGVARKGILYTQQQRNIGTTDTRLRTKKLNSYITL